MYLLYYPQQQQPHVFAHYAPEELQQDAGLYPPLVNHHHHHPHQLGLVPYGSHGSGHVAPVQAFPMMPYYTVSPNPLAHHHHHHYQHQHQHQTPTTTSPAHTNTSPTTTSLGSQLSTTSLHSITSQTPATIVPAYGTVIYPCCCIGAAVCTTHTPAPPLHQSLVQATAGNTIVPHHLIVPAPTDSSAAAAIPTSLVYPNHQINHQYQQQLKHDTYNLISLLPIDAQPTRTCQAYGMDKVWNDEFEQIFSQFTTYSNIVWSLLEVESNPSIRDSARILAYRGCYIVQAGQNLNSPTEDYMEGQGEEEEEDEVEEEDEEEEETENETALAECGARDDKSASVRGSCERSDGEPDKRTACGDETGIDNASSDCCSDCSYCADRAGQSEADRQSEEPLEAEGVVETNQGRLAGGEQNSELESDCDSGAQVNSTSGCSSENFQHSTSTEIVNSNSSSTSEATCEPPGGWPSLDLTHSKANEGHTSGRRFPTRFRMFIDSAKVRFCCDHCGHGWTSMKGRVVFWYELFELTDLAPEMANSTGTNLIGYCAYKLFGQQCDVCKIENRFERPMWYPEEVTKVLNNLYNKIGQVYFGFRMPAIDKQRRAGKPTTSHNSSLCQACHDGICTDRK